MGLFKKKKKISNQQPTSTTPIASSEEVYIKSTEELNKSDGAIIIGEIKDNTLIPNNASMPQAIDIEDRKNKLLLAKKTKEKKLRGKSKASKKASTITSLIVLFLIGVLGGFYYYVTHQEKPTDFQLKEMHIELGDDLPTNVKDYIKKENVDEMEYTLDVSEVKKDEVGEYKYYVTRFNVKKIGKIIIEDTKAPLAETKDLIIKVGETIKADDFITKCDDYSECHFAFEDPNILSKITTPGKHEVYIVVKDKYNNQTRKKAILTIVDQLQRLICNKETDMSESYYNYLQETFTISYADNAYLEHSYIKTLKYTTQKAYEESKNKIKDQSNYKFDDKNMIITIIDKYDLKENYTLTKYQEEFTQLGFTCSVK